MRPMTNYENKSHYKKCEVVDNNYNVNKSNIDFFFSLPKRKLLSLCLLFYNYSSNSEKNTQKE